MGGEGLFVDAAVFGLLGEFNRLLDLQGDREGEVCFVEVAGCHVIKSGPRECSLMVRKRQS